MTKPSKSHVYDEDSVRSACAVTQSDHVSLLGDLWVAKDTKVLYTYSKDSDQTARMHRLF